MSKKSYLITTAIAVIIITVAVVIIANGWGLSKDLDFGAGAYYYADMPGFERWFDKEFYTSHTPLWIHSALFLIWGAVAYRLWVILDRKDNNNV